MPPHDTDITNSLDYAESLHAKDSDIKQQALKDTNDELALIRREFSSPSNELAFMQSCIQTEYGLFS